ncbi:MAG: sigma-70 family RNA polymerase sigma factor [Planctomycetes bacterium]|nr:sigma-70 family RNA polymerase sigma factor [Planctomycetota bacterium]
MRPVPDGDQDMLERARGGDGAALDELLARYLPQLHAFVRMRLGPSLRARETSMDVVQSVCRELLAAPGDYAFLGVDRFRAWLFTAAVNKIRDKLRFHGRDKRALDRECVADEDDPVWREAASLLTPSLDAIGGETAHALSEAMAALSDEHREVITLARFLRVPHAVIAETMERSEEAVRQLLVRALLKLSRELRKRGVELGS